MFISHCIKKHDHTLNIASHRNGIRRLIFSFLSCWIFCHLNMYISHIIYNIPIGKSGISCFVYITGLIAGSTRWLIMCHSAVSFIEFHTGTHNFTLHYVQYPEKLVVLKMKMSAQVFWYYLIWFKFSRLHRCGVYYWRKSWKAQSIINIHGNYFSWS